MSGLPRVIVSFEAPHRVDTIDGRRGIASGAGYQVTPDTVSLDFLVVRLDGTRSPSKVAASMIRPDADLVGTLTELDEQLRLAHAPRPRPWRYRGDRRGTVELVDDPELGVELGMIVRMGAVWEARLSTPNSEQWSTYPTKRSAVEAIASRRLHGNRAFISSRQGPGAVRGGGNSFVVRVHCSCGYRSNNVAGESQQELRDHVAAHDREHREMDRRRIELGLRSALPVLTENKGETR